MTAKQLIALLERFPPNTPVLMQDGDDLRPVEAPEQTTALLDGDGEWQVDLDETAPAETLGVRMKVAVLR